MACVSLSSESSLTLLRARLMTLSGFMKDLGFLSSLWPLLFELPVLLAWSSALWDSVDRIERPPWFRVGEKDGMKPKGLEPFGGSDGGSMSVQTISLEDWGGD